MPAVLDALEKLSNHSATSLAILDPCMADIVQTLAEMRSATSYRDANGNLLRVHPYVFAGTESVNPARIACSGAIDGQPEEQPVQGRCGDAGERAHPDPGRRRHQRQLRSSLQSEPAAAR